MAYEMLVGLQVTDEEAYSAYRAAMTPILERFGGGFRYDFRVSEVLEGESQQHINRVFTIYFENENSKREFFSDPDYKLAKQKFFESSVAATTIIAEYQR